VSKLRLSPEKETDWTPETEIPCVVPKVLIVVADSVELVLTYLYKVPDPTVVLTDPVAVDPGTVPRVNTGEDNTGATSKTVIALVFTIVATPYGLLTVSFTEYMPGVLYVNAGLAKVLSVLPLFLKSQAKEVTEYVVVFTNVTYKG
jgi:hypothetical protein